MSYRRRVKGVHQIYADQQVEGGRVITCACGAEYRCFDKETAWVMFYNHTQDPAHR